jgi:hypothetical protein
MAANQLPDRPPHALTPLRSSVDGFVAVRIDGITYLVSARSAEDFLATYRKAAKESARQLR